MVGWVGSVQNCGPVGFVVVCERTFLIRTFVVIVCWTCSYWSSLTISVPSISDVVVFVVDVDVATVGTPDDKLSVLVVVVSDAVVGGVTWCSAELGDVLGKFGVMIWSPDALGTVVWCAASAGSGEFGKSDVVCPCKVVVELVKVSKGSLAVCVVSPSVEADALGCDSVRCVC